MTNRSSHRFVFEHSGAFEIEAHALFHELTSEISRLEPERADEIDNLIRRGYRARLSATIGGNLPAQVTLALVNDAGDDVMLVILDRLPGPAADGS